MSSGGRREARAMDSENNGAPVARGAGGTARSDGGDSTSVPPRKADPAPDSEPETVLYSRGCDKYDSFPQQRTAASFGDFAEAVLRDRSRAKGLAWISAPFKPNSDGQHHRCKDGALPRRFLAFDQDGGTSHGFVELGMWFGAYSGLGYTTSRHTTKSPRARYILELSRSVDRSEGIRLGEALQRRIEARLGSRVAVWDTSVYRSEQPLLLPLVGAEVMRYYGDPIDVDQVLKDAPPLKERPQARPTDDPYRAALLDRGLVLRELGPGKDAITCPFAEEHSEATSDSSTAYFWPRYGGYQWGGIHCLHAHCAGRNKDQRLYIEKLGLDPRSVWRGQAGTAPCDIPPLESYADDAAREGAARSGNGSGEAVYRRLADIEAKPIRWLWPGRIARGKVFMLAGHPGLGKSQAMISMAAIVTIGGTWPVDRAPCERGSVILLSAEDDAGDTIRPRLEAAEADLTRIYVLEAIREPSNRDGSLITRPFNLGEDMARLSDLARKLGDVALIVIDPITAYLGGVDSYKNAEVRGVLAPLAAMAAEVEAAIVCVSHLNKAGGPEAMLRVMGSLGFVAAARAAYLVAKDPEDETRRLFLPMKNNLAEDRGGLAFRVRGRDLGRGIETSCVEWDADPVTMTADEALTPAADPEERSEMEDAQGFLRELLGDGPVPSKQVRSDADGAGYSWATVRRAQKALGVGAARAGGIGSKGSWVWCLPAKVLKNPLGAHTNTLSALGENEHLRHVGGRCPSCDGEGCAWCSGSGRLVDDQPGETQP